MAKAKVVHRQTSGTPPAATVGGIADDFTFLVEDQASAEHAGSWSNDAGAIPQLQMLNTDDGDAEIGFFLEIDNRFGTSGGWRWRDPTPGDPVPIGADVGTLVRNMVMRVTDIASGATTDIAWLYTRTYPPYVEFVAGTTMLGNGGFDDGSSWTLGTGWAIGSGVATHSTGTASAIMQPYVLANEQYSVVFTVSGRTAGGIQTRMSDESDGTGNATSAALVTTNAQHIQFITPTAGNDWIGS
jgi:hypothetical protein